MAHPVPDVVAPDFDPLQAAPLLVASYGSFRERDQPNLPHETIQMLKHRIDELSDESCRFRFWGNKAMTHKEREEAESYLSKITRAVYILRITPEDGEWTHGLIVEGLREMISDIQLVLNTIQHLNSSDTNTLTYILSELQKLMAELEKKRIGLKNFQLLFSINGDHNNSLTWRSRGRYKMVSGEFDIAPFLEAEVSRKEAKAKYERYLMVERQES